MLDLQERAEGQFGRLEGTQANQRASQDSRSIKRVEYNAVLAAVRNVDDDGVVVLLRDENSALAYSRRSIHRVHRVSKSATLPPSRRHRSSSVEGSENRRDLPQARSELIMISLERMSSFF